MNFHELKNEITKTVRQYFPESYLRIQMSELGGVNNGSMLVAFALGKDNTEWNYGIIHNDPAHTHIWIHGGFNTDDGEVVGKLELDGHMVGIRISGKLDKLGWRNAKVNVTPEKILVTINKYFSKMKEVVK